MFYLIKYSYHCHKEKSKPFSSLEDAMDYAYQYIDAAAFSGCQIENASGEVFYTITRDLLMLDYR